MIWGSAVGRIEVQPFDLGGFGGALVLAVDEIQALERAQGYLKLPNGRALTGSAHNYKPHGTTMRFAALDVAAARFELEYLDF